MNVLVADKTEQFVLNEGTTQRSSRCVAVKLGHFLIAWDVVVLLVEIGCGVQPIRSAVNVGPAVNSIGSGGSIHIDVGAAGRTLLRVVHRSVHVEFLNRLRCGGGDS